MSSEHFKNRTAVGSTKILQNIIVGEKIFLADLKVDFFVQKLMVVCIMTTAAIAIVGAGPSGLLLALELVRQGISPFVLDSREDPDVAGERN